MNETNVTPIRAKTARPSKGKRPRYPTKAEWQARAEQAEAQLSRRPAPPPRAAAWILGVVMPVFSVALSGIAGSLALAGAWPAFAIVALAGLSGLAVSLEHVADSIARTTGSGRRASWCLAIGLELGIVGLELALVTSPASVTTEWAWGLMALLAALVAGANVLAFDHHRAEALGHE